MSIKSNFSVLLTLYMVITLLPIGALAIKPIVFTKWVHTSVPTVRIIKIFYDKKF